MHRERSPVDVPVLIVNCWVQKPLICIQCVLIMVYEKHGLPAQSAANPFDLDNTSGSLVTLTDIILRLDAPEFMSEFKASDPLEW